MREIEWIDLGPWLEQRVDSIRSTGRVLAAPSACAARPGQQRQSWRLPETAVRPKAPSEGYGSKARAVGAQS